jgi:hypothetical protein
MQVADRLKVTQVCSSDSPGAAGLCILMVSKYPHGLSTLTYDGHLDLEN